MGKSKGDAGKEKTKEYQIEFSPKALKELLSIANGAEIEKIQTAVETLAKNPRGQNTIKLQGYENSYRIRVGNYRVVYTIEDKILKVLVVRVAHRKDVYR